MQSHLQVRASMCIVKESPPSPVGTGFRRRMHLLLQAKRTMREADTNGDGMVSKEEFVHLLLGSPVSDSLDAYDARIARQSQ